MKLFRPLLFSASLLLTALQAGAGTVMTYEGIISDSNDNLLNGSVHFFFEIRAVNDPNCILYQEQFNSHAVSAGKFSLKVGSGTPAFGTLATALSNKAAIACKTGESPAPASANYAPAAGENRTIRVLLNDGSGSWQTLEIFQTTDAPSAFSAQTVEGYAANQILRVSGTGTVDAMTQVAARAVRDYGMRSGLGIGIPSTAGSVSTAYGSSMTVPRIKVDSYGRVVELESAQIQIGADSIAVGAVSTQSLSNEAVTTDKMADDAVDTDKVKDGAITGAKMAANSIDTPQIVDNAITSAKIADGTIEAADLKDDSVTSAKIVDGTIETIDLKDDAVTTAKILNGTILAADLASNSVTTAKILNLNVTNDKIANDTIEHGKIISVNADRVTTGTLAIARGGTGLSVTTSQPNKLFGLDNAGTAGELKTLGAGTGISVTFPSPGQIEIANTGVTSVAMSVPSFLTVTPASPTAITTTGTFAVGLVTQTANRVFAGPATGAAATPTFRSLVENDIPTLSTAGKVSGSAINSGTIGGTTAINVSGAIATSSTLTATTGVSTGYVNATGTVTGANLVSNGSVTGTSLILQNTSSRTITMNPPSGAWTNYSMTWPNGNGAGSQVLMNSGTGTLSWSNFIQSLTLNAPTDVFNTTSSTAGAALTTNLILKTQTAATVFAGPATGGAAAPTFRSLASTDIPVLGKTISQGATTTRNLAATDDKSVIILDGDSATTINPGAATDGFVVTLHRTRAKASALQLSISGGVDGATNFYLMPGASITMMRGASSWFTVSSHKVGAINCSSGFVLVGDPGRTGTFCIKNSSDADRTYRQAAAYCLQQGQRLCTAAEAMTAHDAGSFSLCSGAVRFWIGGGEWLDSGFPVALTYRCSPGVYEQEYASGSYGTVCCH